MIKTLVVASVCALALHEPAQAQTTRTFVSANGSDSDPCSRTQPCRTFQGAHDKTNSGGEINVLDPAGYGVLTITKSISIVNEGVGSAGILVPSGGIGITIRANAAAVINLRGLIIEGAGVGQTGILADPSYSLQSLTIENCVIRGLTYEGISYYARGSSSFGITNTLIAEIPVRGINVGPIASSGSAVVRGAFDRIEIYNIGQIGLWVNAGNLTASSVLNTTVVNSVVANAGIGIALDAGGTTSQLLLDRSVIANNGVGGLRAGSANASLRVARSTVTGNNTGWFTIFSGAVLSYGDNYIDGNNGGESAPPSILKK
ncbi:MAG: hypothetical protein QOI12_2452 [Alphaproteobacteria bacterium]|jgi:hypothetical protein|nr:hypothetical protein [Alphaproteobacteria bacterium]